jgi:hypothetical protein
LSINLLFPILIPKLTDIDINSAIIIYSII